MIDDDDEAAGHQRDWLVERNGIPGQLAEHAHFSVRGETLGLGRPAVGPGPGGIFCVAICWKRSGSTVP